jgi:serine protease Do
MKKKLLGIIVLSTLSTLSIGGCNQSKKDLVNTQPSIQIVKESVVDKNQLNLPNFVSLVHTVGNTVVNITAEAQVAVNNAQMDPFFDLFKQFGGQMPRQNQQPQTQLKTSMGSGFIISTDGYILTNAHVVDGAKKITVKVSDKREFTAKLIGADSKTDIALLKVDASSLPTVKIGNPNSLEVGEWVAAIGAPFGFDNSVTQGIVSAKGRNLPTDSYVPFIQTDVPINPGNSGGPLFNLNGEVVGINSQIYSRSGGYMGISFSIPIDIAINIADQLKKSGKVNHGKLGVKVQAVTQQIAKSFGLKDANGALVAEVITASPGEKAGLKSGDIILKVDAQNVLDSSSLPLIIGSKKPLDVVEIQVYRNHKYVVLHAKLGDSLVADSAIGANDSNGAKSNDTLTLDKFGLTITNLSEADKKQLNINAGVVITNTQGIGQISGLTSGDVILSVNNQLVSNTNQAKNLLANTNIAALLILRGQQQMFVTISSN